MIGKTGKFVVPLRTAAAVKFLVDVKIVGERNGFGRHDLEITPVSGSGKAFVSSKNVEDIKP